MAARKKSNTKTVLVTGIAGSLARLTAMDLQQAGYEVVGVDYRAKPADFPRSVEYYQANYNKTRIADVFKRHRPRFVLHLGRVGNLRVRQNKRYDLNVVGSSKIQELSRDLGVSKLIVLSTFHIYGAHPNNHVPISEDEPLRALQTVPKLSDAIQIDSQAVTWTYRHRELQTIVLRPSNVIGPHINNTISTYLRQPNIPTISGFNPMWQFIYETDMVLAIRTAMESDEYGVYNVAAAGALPVVEAVKLTGARSYAIPQALMPLMRRLSPASSQALPSYLVDFLKYPVVVDTGKIERELGYKPRVRISDAIRACVTRMPAY